MVGSLFTLVGDSKIMYPAPVIHPNLSPAFLSIYWTLSPEQSTEN